MCTIGAVRLNDGAMALFKNKDFSARQFSDHVVLAKDLFGSRGLETFAKAESEMVFSGFSIGANEHGLLGTVNHVKITEAEHQNYDCLTELVLRQARSVKQAAEIVQHAVQNQAYWWGNLVFADKTGSMAVEIRGHDCKISEIQDHVFRTNHQPLFGEVSSPDHLPCSAKRYAAMQHRLGGVDTLHDIKAMLRAHDDNGTGICNHGVPLTTVYAYILVLRGDSIEMHIVNGLPCQGDWTELTLPIGDLSSDQNIKQFLTAYPGLAA